MMFYALSIAMLILALAGLIYIFFSFHQFAILRRMRRGTGWLLAALPLLALAVYAYLDFVNAMVVVVHGFAIWGFWDVVGFFVRRRTGHPRPPKRPKKGSFSGKEPKASYRYWEGAGALVCTALLLSWGYYACHTVTVTRYDLTTEKALAGETLTVVQLADTHIGTTFDGEEFAEELALVQQQHPDIVVVTGDFVDDGTSRADMVTSCQALGNLQTTAGVYFVFGNHDEGYYQTREFRKGDLAQTLRENGVILLEDQVVPIGEGFLLAGRQDNWRAPNRMTAEALLSGQDPHRYAIVLDHAPNDFDGEAASGADLVLCGHTHGGQLFPLGIFGDLLGANDSHYGLSSRGETQFIVNSGMSDWALDFKTGTRSEIVVVTISQSE